MKQMLREKYWSPLMNSMIDTAIHQFYECNVTTKDHQEEPIKVMNTPGKPWDTVSVDHGDHNQMVINVTDLRVYNGPLQRPEFFEHRKVTDTYTYTMPSK